jgi:hypothetical protein
VNRQHTNKREQTENRNQLARIQTTVENQLAREHRRQKTEEGRWRNEISATESKRPLLEQSIKRREERRRHTSEAAAKKPLSLSS